MLSEAGRRLDADTLIDRFWGEEPPPTARAALQTHLSGLRRQLGETLITTAAAGYRVELGAHEFDAAEFDALATTTSTAYGRAGWADVADQAVAALRLWRGHPYPELQDDAFAAPEIARLEELRAELIEMRAEALLALGRNEEALPDLERHTPEYPYRERLWEHLMLARARLGRVTDALAAYHQARAAFDELGLEPGPTLRALEERIFREDPTLVPSRIRHNLPPRLTSFVGRDVERSELPGMLAEHRLVTLTGVGGCGKTRLAFEVAEKVLLRFPDGIWMADLAAISDPNLVSNELAMVLGLPIDRPSVEGSLGESLRSRTLLILLDNCEHVLSACARLSAVLLAAGPGVRVLATSREPLGVVGELVYPVRPLDVPETTDGDALALAGSASVRLFTDRAALVSRGFTLDSDNATTVASICRRLDGLPLAIELAAARMSSLSPEDVADRLDNRFRLLARSQPGSPARHQTLQATVAWSYDHLTDGERALFARLAVFNGTFTLEMVEDICTDPSARSEPVAAVLANLVDKSLVAPIETTGGRRYRLLETIREYARDRLRESGALADVARRHADWFLRLAEEATDHLDDSGQAAWLDRLDTERDNIQAALDWSREFGASRHVARLAEVLAWYRAKHGQFEQAIADIRTALEHLDPDPEREATLHVRAAGAMYSAAQEHAALASVRRARDLVANRDPSAVKVRALTEYADMHLRIVQDDPGEVIGAAEAAAATAAIIGDRSAHVRALRTLGTAMASAGRTEEGVFQLRRALSVARELGEPSALLGVYMRLHIALIDYAGDHHAAAELADEELAWLDAGGDRWGGAASLVEWICLGFIMSGDLVRAEELLRRVDRFHVEGSVKASKLTLHAAMRWMQGRYEEADTAIEGLREAARATRYYRVLFPLAAAVRADQGRLDEVRALTEEHGAAEVRGAEEATKVGTLSVLVRAEADAAVASRGAPREDHIQRARAATERAQELLLRSPPGVLAGFRLERPQTFLALAEAEASRLARPIPDRWRRVAEQATYAYWRTYAGWRLAESLHESGDTDEARRTVLINHQRAARMGAAQLVRQIEAWAGSAGIAL